MLPSGANNRLPSTLGGPGWIPRRPTHLADVHANDVWRSCGVDSESQKLLEVVLAWPPDCLARALHPDDDLLLQQPNLARMRHETETVAGLLRSQGITAHVLKNPAAPANIVFMRDAFFMTPEGAILARPAAAQRAAEAPIVAAYLSSLRIPILATIHGTGTFEGADALWLRPQSVLIGIGNRTNEQGAAQVRALLSAQGVQVTVVPLPRGVQHLLGVVNFVAPGLVACDRERMTGPIERRLREHSIDIIALDEHEELAVLRILNFVTLAPSVILAPVGAEKSVALLSDHGVTVLQVDISEHLKCAGGIACMAGILKRVVTGE